MRVRVRVRVQVRVIRMMRVWVKEGVSYRTYLATTCQHWCIHWCYWYYLQTRIHATHCAYYDITPDPQIIPLFSDPKNYSITSSLSGRCITSKLRRRPTWTPATTRAKSSARFELWTFELWTFELRNLNYECLNFERLNYEHLNYERLNFERSNDCTLHKGLLFAI